MRPARVLDTTRSPFARMHAAPVGSIRLLDEFWQPRREMNLTRTLPAQHDRLESTGRIDNFRRAAGKVSGVFQGRYYNDSDVYKWVEAVSWHLAEADAPDLEACLESVIREIAAAQEPDGYLNTHFAREKLPERYSNLRDMHEIYCAGHLVQAAVAHHRATGSRTLLEVAVRLADHLEREFGPGGRAGACGHQEAEMALVELARLVGEPRYVRLAERMIDARGGTPPLLGGSPYHQDHVPFVDLEGPVGHAVRMLYYCCGAADVVLETGRADYSRALERILSRMRERRTYVTGGVGARWEGEAFGADYELPNERAYAETCAAIGVVMAASRMLALTGNAEYADLVEWTLYNAVLPGVSLDGTAYFYQNPLADDGAHRRREWFDCACCPPNLARLLAFLPSLYASSGGSDAWVHLYSRATFGLPSAHGPGFGFRMDTGYPWDGEVLVTVENPPAGVAGLHFRIPGWVGDGEAAAMLNGTSLPASAGTYLSIRREWRAGDTIRLSLPVAVRRIRAHPFVDACQGAVALARGPLLYCLEQVDAVCDPRELLLPREDAWTEEREPELPGCVVALRGEMIHHAPGAGWDHRLYRSQVEEDPPPARKMVLLIPYYSWANREPGGMRVWLRSP